jgi:hypothetical protein
MLEAALRARVRRLPSVEFIDRCDVAGLTTELNGTRVTGRGWSKNRRQRGADLDRGSGRGRHGPRFPYSGLARDAGIPASARGSGAGRHRVRQPDLPACSGLFDEKLGIVNAPTPDNRRGGALATIENERFLVTLIGVLGDYPPTDPGGFTEFANTLQFPDISQVLRAAEPLDEPVPFRHHASIRHRYEQLSSFPRACW